MRLFNFKKEEKTIKNSKRVNVNNRIRAKRVLVIGPGGEKYGEKSIDEALDLAYEAGLDLVEVAPSAKPPVCKIMDYGKYKYDKEKKAQKAKKRQKKIVTKEIQFRPKTQEHDYQFKKRHIDKFLHKGYRVKCVVFFRGREMTRQDLGNQILDRLLEEFGEDVEVISRTGLEGRYMTMLITPSKTLTEKIEKEKKDG